MANKIIYNRGTTFNIGHVYQINGVNATTGTSLLFTVKPATDGDIADSAAIIKKTIAMTGASNMISITPADISSAQPEGQYVYDIKVIDSTLGTQLADKGIFILSVTATNRLA